MPFALAALNGLVLHDGMGCIYVQVVEQKLVFLPTNYYF